jgi:hypothetical protein
MGESLSPPTMTPYLCFPQSSSHGWILLSHVGGKMSRIPHVDFVDNSQRNHERCLSKLSSTIPFLGVEQGPMDGIP